jgi:hypothetical protein
VKRGQGLSQNTHLTPLRTTTHYSCRHDAQRSTCLAQQRFRLQHVIPLQRHCRLYSAALTVEIFLAKVQLLQEHLTSLGNRQQHDPDSEPYTNTANHNLVYFILAPIVVHGQSPLRDLKHNFNSSQLITQGPRPSARLCVP